MGNRIDEYCEIDRRIITNVLQGIWNRKPYKSCKDINEVWEIIIEETGSSELIAIIEIVDNQTLEGGE